ncbi:protoheme IX farnesyltransferase SCDLUD_002195 [Saccharomycodes ludwigii]|uniref:protoheme IX farnesyltransferase n=1 Tax=Saccharomycodes ludwigii TaxID=36035 RepID=UPI001E82D978|nr:hypothetical protein SCDLUD_002195 [Saccharomycodes ludwigii]KAH3902375.1 hypothetical protein SCDLUD_002195 [Saccharomycodes ludwigii]
MVNLILCPRPIIHAVSRNTNRQYFSTRTSINVAVSILNGVFKKDNQQGNRFFSNSFTEKQQKEPTPQKPIVSRSNALNTSPIEFSSNLSNIDAQLRIPDSAKKVFTCTPDVSDKLDHDIISEQTTSSYPFKVKYVNKVKNTKNTSSSSAQQVDIKKIMNAYFQLSKPRLTVLVMLSAICSYALSPYAASIPQLLSLTVGTTLCSTAANAINMGREPEFDRRMIRTQARPVVRGTLSPRQAFTFAGISGTLGTLILYFGVNPTVALLGASNIILYAWIYTSLKRKHIINTWVGAIVGAIPPLMGWAAASPLTDPGCWCLAGLLYAWQFPHFNTLSHNIKNEYKNAGYVMTAWKNPKLNARVALRYSLLMFPLCFGLSYFGICDWYYQIDSGIANTWLSFWAFMFWWQQKKNYSSKICNDSIAFNKGLSKANVYARKTFWISVLQLPAVLILAILHKKGRWDGIFDNDNNNNTVITSKSET